MILFVINIGLKWIVYRYPAGMKSFRRSSMNKRMIVFVCLLVFSVGGVMAYSSMSTVGLDYGAVGTLRDSGKNPLSFTGIQLGVYTYSDEYGANGFYSQVSFQLSNTEGDPDDLFFAYMMNIVSGYTRRFDLGGMFDLLIGVGPSYQQFDLNILGGAITGKGSMIGLAATAEANFLLLPWMTINWGATAHVGIYDLTDRKVIDKKPITARTYVGAGFTF